MDQREAFPRPLVNLTGPEPLAVALILSRLRRGDLGLEISQFGADAAKAFRRALDTIELLELIGERADMSGDILKLRELCQAVGCPGQYLPGADKQAPGSRDQGPGLA
jgi:hypothetical protein